MPALCIATAQAVMTRLRKTYLLAFLDTPQPKGVGILGSSDTPVNYELEITNYKLGNLNSQFVIRNS